MLQPTAFESYRAAALARGYVKHIRKIARSVLPPRKRRVRSLASEAIDWLLPWGMDDYPGKQRGFAEIAGAGSIETVRSWLKGHRTLPSPVARRLAEHIRSRVSAGLALADELEAASKAAKPRRLGQGFTRVDPVTGLDGRSRAGRRKVKEL